jgi:predicted ATP-dependent serine protease
MKDLKQLKAERAAQQPTADPYSLLVQAENFIKRMSQEKTGLSIGFPHLEKWMDSGGFQPGQLISIISKPKVGKTFFVTNAIHHLIEHQKKTLFISVEMNSYSILKRMHRLAWGCGYDEMKETVLADPEKVRMLAYKWRPFLKMIDMKEINLEMIGKYIDTHEPEAVFVDYIQIVNANEPLQSEMEKVSRVAKGLADLCQVKNTDIFALSQTAKDDIPGWQMPSAASGKWSSDIHIASDVLIGMARLDTNPSVAECDKNKLEIQILESRYGGSSPVVTYHYDMDTTRITHIDTWDSINPPGRSG